MIFNLSVINHHRYQTYGGQKDQNIFDPKEIARRSRAKDIKKTVDILVGQDKNADLTIVPIIGIRGLGKTTLAQLVYNDREILRHFDVLLSVCAYESFHVDTLAKSIVEAAPEKKNDDKEVVASVRINPRHIVDHLRIKQSHEHDTEIC